MKNLTKAFMATVVAAGTASAATFASYSTDFSSADGFADATSLDEVDGWNGRATQVTANTGTYGSTALGNGPAFTQKGSGGSWNAGDEISITAGVFYDNTTTRVRFRVGLTDVINDTSGAPKVNFEFDARTGGDIFAFGGGINENTGLDFSTGQANGELYTVTLTKSATLNEIDVAVSFRGGAYSNSFTATNADIYGAANVYGHIQSNGGANGHVDSYSQTFTSVPEPSALVLLGLGTMGLISRRRRN